MTASTPSSATKPLDLPDLPDTSAPTMTIAMAPASTNAELITASAAVTATLAAIEAQARDYAREAKSKNTRRAYRSDWADFAGWCQAHGLGALPAAPATVALYLTSAAERCKPATLTRRLTAISHAHQAAEHPSPTTSATVRAVASGIRRAKGTAQQGKAAAVTDEVRLMVGGLPPTRRGRRDRALLLLGFAGAFRRSELVALDVADVEEKPEGLVVTLRRSKTDQEGEGRRVGIPYGGHPQSCPIRALRAWLDDSGIVEGALFRGVKNDGTLLGRLSDKGVARVVQRRAAAVGLDPKRYGGHSLRAGLATAAAAAGKSERAIMAQTGHKSSVMVRRYIRSGELFSDNAAAGLGL